MHGICYIKNDVCYTRKTFFEQCRKNTQLYLLIVWTYNGWSYIKEQILKELCFISFMLDCFGLVDSFDLERKLVRIKTFVCSTKSGSRLWVLWMPQPVARLINAACVKWGHTKRHGNDQTKIIAINVVTNVPINSSFYIMFCIMRFFFAFPYYQ